ncbi:hypothetical protein Patl1_04237 [Pistacia atlantica]|uniref:Uncharacterized protein n=1 Tax=Pistacia atlantica TaxID=434234 RepID=A0ACC1BV64_9ROSI|nr:hypothetical protein Patl1_04237 [Pistacia atlantica]
MTYSRMDGDRIHLFSFCPMKTLRNILVVSVEEMLRATLRHRLGYLHESLNSLIKKLISELFKGGFIQVCVIYSWMMGHAFGRPLLDNSGKCVILCHAPRKEYYKKELLRTSKMCGLSHLDVHVREAHSKSKLLQSPVVNHSISPITSRAG